MARRPFTTTSTTRSPGSLEHDTFRSNQIREGQLSRAQALTLIADDNRPRYQNIKWYLDTLGLDFRAVVDVVNGVRRMYWRVIRGA
jgi:hypothetical protein